MTNHDEVHRMPHDDHDSPKTLSKNCVFCGAPLGAGKSKEHVLPQWYLDSFTLRDVDWSLDHIDPNQASDSELVSRRTHKLGNLLLGPVCTTCNTRWMSDLEQQAKPLLLPLMRGESSLTALGDGQRFIVARWALKTACTLNFATNFHQIIPVEHAQALRTNPQSLPEGTIVVASQVPPTDELNWIQGRSWHLTATEESKDYLLTLLKKSYKVCFQLQSLILLIGFFPPDPRAQICKSPQLHFVLANQAGKLQRIVLIKAKRKKGIPKGIEMWVALRIVDPECIANMKKELEVAKRKLGKNAPCFCGSGLKFKRCHLKA